MEGDPGRFRLLLNRAIGAKVAQERRCSGKKLSQSELASEAGVTRAAMSAIEAGSQGTSLVTLCRIARALDVEPGGLLPGKGELESLLRQAGEVPGLAVRETVEEYLKEEGYGYSEGAESGDEGTP
jgi:transcriptional regulator with XRE-family HTH domain